MQRSIPDLQRQKRVRFLIDYPIRQPPQRGIIFWRLTELIVELRQLFEDLLFRSLAIVKSACHRPQIVVPLTFANLFLRSAIAIQIEGDAANLTLCKGTG